MEIQVEALLKAAIYYHPEGYTTQGKKLMGRNAAGESFLRGYLRHSKSDEFWVQVPERRFARQFADTVRAAGRIEPISVVDDATLRGLGKVGQVYYPGPGIGSHAWKRSLFGHHGWSLSGITHTTSSAGAMDSLCELLNAPIQPWDALICTSRAVKDNVIRVLDAQAQYIADRFGATRIPTFMLPVIPLGIHTADFSFTQQQKDAARKSIGADEKTLVVLYLGRLSFHAKAHPLAMYQALQKATDRLSDGQQVLLVECGWHGNDDIARAYQEAAALACPGVRVVHMDGRDPQSRGVAWASADLLCSLSDNIQETYGIVPVEGMAAGLPVVVSDWDGYRDTVRQGVDGFRVPTITPASGSAADLASRHALEIDTYDMYCGHTCSLVGVDVDAAADAFSQLFASPALRRKMGDAGRQRARQEFDWSVIIPRYESLWAEQAQLRGGNVPRVKSLATPWPARMEPFTGFASYPTRMLHADSLLAGVDPSPEQGMARVTAYKKLAMVNFANYVMPSDDTIQILLEAMVDGPKAIGQLGSILGNHDASRTGRILAWLLKMGVVRYVPDQRGDASLESVSA